MRGGRGYRDRVTVGSGREGEGVNWRDAWRGDRADLESFVMGGGEDGGRRWVMRIDGKRSYGMGVRGRGGAEE